MTTHLSEQTEQPSIWQTGFAFERVIQQQFEDFHEQHPCPDLEGFFELRKLKAE